MRTRNKLGWILATVAASTLASVAIGALLGLPAEHPSFLYVNGTTSYDAGSGLFQVSSPKNRNFDLVSGERITVVADPVLGRTFDIAFFVDADGNAIGGVPGDDMVITGGLDLDQNGSVDVSGVLLTGEVQDFGFLDDGDTDLYDVLVLVTGGVADFLFDTQVLVTVTSANSDFVGDFTVSFSGDASGKACITFAPFCGDGVLDEGEFCDDGNNEDGDGCSATCEVEEQGEGCTPGYWKQKHHFDSWVGYAPSNGYEATFGVDASFNLSLLGALKQGGGGEKALGRHAVAALLDASSGIAYGLSEAEVIAIVQGAYASGEFNAAKNLLADLNEQGCPLN